MTGIEERGGGGFRRDHDPAEHGEFKRLAARVAKLEKVIADASRAGFAWAGHMVHGSPESVEEVKRLVLAGKAPTGPTFAGLGLGGAPIYHGGVTLDLETGRVWRWRRGADGTPLLIDDGAP